MNDVDLLANVLRSRFNHVAIREDYGWPRNSALSVIDCVLSLNRRYDGFVLPRVEAFARQHPEVTELAHLAEMLDSYPVLGEFCLREFNYNHVQREQTLRGVLRHLMSVQAKRPGTDEWDRLHAWASLVKPGDYLSVGVPGFGLSGFQYMRMLFGAQTTKPDVHVIRFVSQIAGRRVSDAQALQLLEAAAGQVSLPLREVDGAIWEASARGALSGVPSGSVRAFISG